VCEVIAYVCEVVVYVCEVVAYVCEVVAYVCEVVVYGCPSCGRLVHMYELVNYITVTSSNTQRR